jgi:hypothetical protein
MLHWEIVEAERTRADQVLNPGKAAAAFQGTTVEMTTTTEKPVVSKQAHVVEDMSLKAVG